MFEKMNNNIKSDEIISYQEAERKRIADDLHDTTIQKLIFLLQQLELANLYFDKDVNQARLEVLSAQKNVKNIISEMREIIYDLKPIVIEQYGWSSAFDRLYKEMLKNGIDVTFKLVESQCLNSETAITVYRIVKEACINIIKHAKATKAELVMEMIQDDLLILIKDNGRGFTGLTNKENHFGLNMMRERVALLSGVMKIKSDLNNGTEIFIKIPINKE